jgi:hypothetical protein
MCVACSLYVCAHAPKGSKEVKGNVVEGGCEMEKLGFQLNLIHFLMHLNWKQYFRNKHPY